MAGNENTIELTFKMNDQGSITVDKINAKLGEIGQNTEKMNKSLGLIKFSSIVQMGEAAFHTAERIYRMGRETASAINDIDRMAKIAGMTTEQYQKMSYAAKMSDVDVEAMSRGMKTLSGHMDDVRKGSASAVELFEGIGVSTVDASGKMKSFDVILGDLADRFKTMPDGVEKVALATDLFGKSGQNLIPMLNQGRIGLQEFYREAERLGVVLDESLIKKGSELEDKFKKAEAWWSAFFKKIVIGAYDAIKAVEKLNDYTLTHPSQGWVVPTKKPVSMFSFGDIGLEPMEQSAVFLRRSEEAIKAIAKATEEAAKKEAQLNEFFASDAELLKQATREVERKNQALGLISGLGVKTEMGARADIEKMMEEFKLIASMGLRPEELEQVKAKYVASLEEIKAKYTSTFGEITEELRDEEGNLKVAWTRLVPKDELTRNVEEMVRNAITELDRMQRQIDRMSQQPNKIMIDTTEFNNANRAIEMLQMKLENLTERDWPLVISITGRGSSELPIMEKIDEITRAFDSMGSDFGNMVLTMNLSQIRAQMEQIQASMRMDTSTGMFGTGSWDWQYARSMYEATQKQKVSQLNELQAMYNQLSSMNFGGGGGGYGGGSGGGGISINIGVINVIGGSDMEIAQKLDEALADLWMKDRSKLKGMIT